MLYLVSLGLGDAKDITVKGCEIVKNVDFVFLEAYTSILCVGQQVLVRIWTDARCGIAEKSLHIICVSLNYRRVHCIVSRSLKFNFPQSRTSL